MAGEIVMALISAQIRSELLILNFKTIRNHMNWKTILNGLIIWTGLIFGLLDWVVEKVSSTIFDQELIKLFSNI